MLAGIGVTVGEGDADISGDALGNGDDDASGVALGEGDADGVTVGDGDADTSGVAVGLGVGVGAASALNPDDIMQTAINADKIFFIFITIPFFAKN